MMQVVIHILLQILAVVCGILVIWAIVVFVQVQSSRNKEITDCPAVIREVPVPVLSGLYHSALFEINGKKVRLYLSRKDWKELPASGTSGRLTFRGKVFMKFVKTKNGNETV